MQKISEAEMEIMEIIWSHNNPLTSKDIMLLLTNKNWKITTILTLISRLIDKGFLISKKDGRNNLYSFIISKNEYKKQCSKNFIDEFYQGSIKNFFTALCSYGEISPEDLIELKDIIDKGGDLE